MKRRQGRESNFRRSLVALSLGLGSLFSSSLAWGAGQIGDNGTPIATSDYAIDLFQGPVLAGTRVTGLGGAYVAIAEDVDGDLQNAASAANRPFFSVSFFDWWAGLGFVFPGSLQNMDYFNSGSDTQLHNSPDSLVFLTPSLNLQWGPWGMGVTSEISSYDFGTRSESGDEGRLSTLITVNHLQVARSFWKGQIVGGFGSRVLAMHVQAGLGLDSLFTTAGSGFEAGALFRPTGLPFRLGLSARSKVSTHASFSDDLLPDENGDITIETEDGSTVYVPRRVQLPWDLNFGAAVQFGRRPFNHGWRTYDPADERARLQFELREVERREERDRLLSEAGSDEERAQISAEYRHARRMDRKRKRAEQSAAYWVKQQELADMKRFYLLVSTSMVVSGRATDAVGVESFLNQTVNRSGEDVVLSPRLGLESEVWADVLKLRGGSYLEPSRFEGGRSRLHGTAGLDLRLIRWSVFGIGPDDYLWRLALSADMAERYFTWGIMVGGWYSRHSGAIDSKWTQ